MRSALTGPPGVFSGSDPRILLVLVMLAAIGTLLYLMLKADRAGRAGTDHRATRSTDRNDDTRGAAPISPVGVAVKLALFMTLVIAHRVVVGIRGVRR